MKNLSKKLFKLQDLKYKEFQSALIPTIDKNSMIGVRTPELKKIAKELFSAGEYSDFLNSLPHKYFEENQIHGFIISLIKDFDEQIVQLEKFFLFIDNWATCDQIVPKSFAKNQDKLFAKIKNWIQAGDKAEYEVRFGIRMLMNYFLEEHFTDEVLEVVVNIKSEKYYVQMMIAWFFATALAKQYDAALKVIQSGRLEKWTQNKTIQKAVESFRVTPEHKEELRKLKIQDGKIKVFEI
ncbi:MAG: DNA alkylation repair protein [Treponema sp.]